MLPDSAQPRFQFVEQLGRGGTAEVAHVIDRQTGRKAALKYPLPDKAQPDDLFPNLAIREFDLIGKLRYHGIVHILEPPGNRPDYLLMELCQGKTLDQLSGQPPLPRVLNLISATAAALELCRARGIVHGDLKPSNLFLPQDWDELPDGSMFYVRLSDFSLGKRFQEDETARCGVGTVGYMAPETIRGEPTSHASDLFALGVIAYQLLTGRHPYLHETSEPAAVNSSILEQPPALLNKTETGGCDELAALIESLLAADEADRPDSAFQVCEQLAQMGASYPFRRNLRPSFFLDETVSFETNLSHHFACSEQEQDWLETICDRSVSKLRLLLTANHARGNMIYENGNFRFRKRIYWPSILRRRSVEAFSGLSFGDKRRAVHLAIRETDANGKGQTDQLDTEPPCSTLRLLKHLLLPRTVRILSVKYAPAAEADDDPKTAASMHVQGGNFDAAERCALQAAISLQAAHQGNEAIGILKKVIRYGDLLGREYDCCSLLLLMGDLYKEQGESAQSEEAFLRVVRICEGHPPDELLARAHRSLGDLYRLKRDFAQAISSLNRARKICEDLNQHLEVSRVLNNLGNTYWLTAQMDKALHSYRLALRTQRDLDALSEVASTLNNIGNVYGAQGRYKRCIRILKLSLEIKKELGHAGEIARTLNNLGYAYYITGEMSAAVDSLGQSLTMNRRIGSRKEILFNLENLAAITIAAGRPKQALDNLAEGLAIADEVGDEGHSAIFRASEAIAHRRLGDFGMAISSLSHAEFIAEHLDSIHIDLNIALQHAFLKYSIGDVGEALRLGRKIARDSEQADDAEILLSSLLLITRLDGSEEYYNQAHSLIADMHLVREARLLKFNRIEYLLNDGTDNGPGNNLEQLEEMLLSTGDDIEIPWMSNRLAQAYHELGDLNRAAGHVDRALALSHQYGLLPDLADAHLLRGRLQYDFGEYEKSYADYKKSLICHRRISDTLVSEPDRHHYQSKRTVRFLAEEIRRLHERLAKTKGQA